MSLHTLANHTHVSEEIMRDILSGEDALNLQEGLRLFEFFHFYSIPNDIYSFDYLLACKFPSYLYGWIATFCFSANTCSIL